MRSVEGLATVDLNDAEDVDEIIRSFDRQVLFGRVLFVSRSDEGRGDRIDDGRRVRRRRRSDASGSGKPS
jgi:hypothetical protein